MLQLRTCFPPRPWLCICLWIASVTAVSTSLLAQVPPAPNPSPFGPNVYVITPSMSTSSINGLLNSLNQEAQFSTNRYAVLFQPGVYGSSSSPVGAQVGYYEQISGLGALPTGVSMVGGMGVDQLIGTAPTADMTQNFWRSMENFSEQAASGTTGILDWGVSQGASLFCDTLRSWLLRRRLQDQLAFFRLGWKMLMKNANELWIMERFPLCHRPICFGTRK